MQGVFYRATAVREARALGLAGYARNLADGRVEVLACGDEPSVDAFLRWLWVGSSASSVSGVEVTSVDAAQADRVGAEFLSR